MTRLERPPSLWRAFASYGVWAVCFTVLYTGHALGCSWLSGAYTGTHPPDVSTDVLTIVLASVWIFFILWLVALTLRSGAWARTIMRAPSSTQDSEQTTNVLTEACFQYVPQSPAWPVVRRRSLRFMVALTFIADASAIVVTVISGLPIVLAPACV